MTLAENCRHSVIMIKHMKAVEDIESEISYGICEQAIGGDSWGGVFRMFLQSTDEMIRG